jgi:hypothetical protein
VVFPEPVLSRNEPAVLLLSLAGVIRSVWSSQAHLWSAALVFLTAAALVEGRWWSAAFSLALAVHLKLSPLVLAGIVAALWTRKMSGRLLLALGAWTALPFVRGRPIQVAGMYGEWLARLRTLTLLRLPAQRDVFHLFEILGVSLPVGAYRALQILAGLFVLGWAWRLQRRGLPAEWLVSGAFALTIAYMLALGPAVEFVQYPLLAPWVSGAVLAAESRRERFTLAVIFGMTMVAGFGAVEDALGRWVGSEAPQSLITLGTLAFAAWVVLKWRVRGARPRSAFVPNFVRWARGNGECGPRRREGRPRSQARSRGPDSRETFRE